MLLKNTPDTMISLVPANVLPAKAPASAHIEHEHRQQLLPHVPVNCQQWSNGYLLTQTFGEGQITVQRFIVQLYQADNLLGNVSQNTLLLSWLQQGMVEECFIDHHGKACFTGQCLRMLYMPAHTGFKSSLSEDCYVFTIISFAASALSPSYQLHPYAGYFINMHRQNNQLPLPGSEVPCSPPMQHYIQLLGSPGEKGENLQQLVNTYAACVKDEPIIHNKNIRRMAAIDKYINAHIQNPCILGDIASHMQLSEGTIKHVVKNICNQAVGEFVIEKRMQHGRALLHANREMRVAEVAEAVGCKPTYFSRLFTRRFGTSPGDFQKTM